MIRDKVLILDPPYGGSQASYNAGFDGQHYWNFVKEMTGIAKSVIIFDRETNITLHQGLPICGIRQMRVNGKHKGDVEAVAIFKDGVWQNQVLVANQEVTEETATLWEV